MADARTAAREAVRRKLAADAAPPRDVTLAWVHPEQVAHSWFTSIMGVLMASPRTSCETPRASSAATTAPAAAGSRPEKSSAICGEAAIRDSEIASESLGVNIARTKLALYVATAALTTMTGALIFLQKLRISPDAAFSVNDWTAYVIFMVVIGGIGTIEGPIIGTLIFFVLRETLSDLGTIYLMLLGAVAIFVMLKAPKGLWGLFTAATGVTLFPLRRRVVRTEEN
mgnify:CR=1 FL=1